MLLELLTLKRRIASAKASAVGLLRKSYETGIGSMNHIRIVDVSAAKHDSSQEGRSVGPQEGGAVGQEAVPWGNQRRAFR